MVNKFSVKVIASEEELSKINLQRVVKTGDHIIVWDRDGTYDFIDDGFMYSIFPEMCKKKTSNTWHSWTIGFSNLTEEQIKIVCDKLSDLEVEFDKGHGITVEAITNDSGEF